MTEKSGADARAHAQDTPGERARTRAERRPSVCTCARNFGTRFTLSLSPRRGGCFAQTGGAKERESYSLSIRHRRIEASPMRRVGAAVCDRHGRHPAVLKDACRAFSTEPRRFERTRTITERLRRCLVAGPRGVARRKGGDREGGPLSKITCTRAYVHTPRTGAAPAEGGERDREEGPSAKIACTRANGAGV